MRALSHYIRYALRQFKQSPGFTIATVLCLAIGIGANVALFDVTTSLLYPDLGIRDPDRIVRIYSKWSDGTNYGSISIPDYEDVRDRVEAFENVAVEAFAPFHLATGGKAERTWGMEISGNYFATLGVDMALGRDLSPEEYRELGTHPVMLISHGYWKRRFGGDPGVINREVTLNGYTFKIIGVVGPAFRSGMVGAYSDLFVPLAMREQILHGWNFSRGNHWLNNMVARLKDGVTIEQANAEVNAVFASLREEYPDTNIGLSANVLPEGKSSLHPMMRSQFAAVLILLMSLTGILLLLTCANVAGLILARSSDRRRELGVRLALGANRRQLIGQLMAESALLGLTAGIVAFLLSFLLIPLVQSAQPHMDIPLQFSSGINPSLVWFTPLVSLLAAFFFGFLPALEVSRQDITSVLLSGRATSTKRSHHLRSLLVGGQVAMSLVLLVSAGLVLHSMQNVENINPGFDPTNQLIVTFDLDLQGYSEEEGYAFHRRLKDRLRAMPGVVAVGSGQIVPFSFSNMSTWVYPEGYEIPGERPPSISWYRTDQGYFSAMGIPVLRGRAFTERDNDDVEPVMIVNQLFADLFWPGEDPIGKVVRLGDSDGTAYRIIGVTPTGRYMFISETPIPFFYLSFHQRYTGDMNIHARTTGDPSPLSPAVQTAIQELDPELPIARLTTMESHMDLAYLPSRMVAGSVSGFAALALLLATIGLYGLIAYSVSQQTREIGIRIALGAQAGNILFTVVRRGIILVAAGVIIGLLLGLGWSMMMSRILYGLEPIDVRATVAALTVLTITAVVASYVPARRATKVDPVEALRVE